MNSSPTSKKVSMEPIPFTIPVSLEKTIIFEDYSGPQFYPHLHRHKEFQLMWIICGNGTLIADHNIFRFNEADIFLLGASQPHVFKNAVEYLPDGSKKNIKGLSVFFNLQGPLHAVFSLPELSSVHSFLKNSMGGFRIPDNNKEELAEKIIELKSSKGAVRMSLFFSMIHFMYSLKEDLVSLSTKSESEPYPEEKSRRIQVIYDYILKNFENDISLEEVAEQAFLTPPAFCRYFKKHTGKTFVSFLNELRVNQACKKLVTEKDEAQISNIAYECGFKSVTNFNRVFKTVIGSSPSVYQRRFLMEVGESNLM